MAGAGGGGRGEGIDWWMGRGWGGERGEGKTLKILIDISVMCDNWRVMY